MKKKENLPSIFIISIPTILVVATYLADIHCTILGAPLYLYAFIYPLIYLFSCATVKQSGLKNAFNVMALALIIQTAAFVVEWVLLNMMDSYLMIHTFMSFLIEQLILLFVYDFLVKIELDTYFPLFLLILGVSAINNIFFGALVEGYCISLSILPRLAYAIFIPAVLGRKTKKVKK